MPKKEKEQTPEEFDHAAAHLILGKFLSQDADAVIELLDEIGDPVVSAAVAIRICVELDPTQIAEFLSLLESDDADADPDDCGEDDEKTASGTPEG